MANIRDQQTQQIIAVIADGRVQRLNAWTILVNGVVIEFGDAVELEDLDDLDTEHGKAAQLACK